MLESLQSNKFEYKKLTEEEQKTRGILGRLAGVIADFKNPTRNGRIYSKELWEKVFEDPIMQEKIQGKKCFGELGHPEDRDTLCEEKIAICLAEMPKLGKDGKLYGVFDILNTPNGKILKTLCDYGAEIGVSSRGTGNIIGDDEVDPDTYQCVGWDAVIIPAVKAAVPHYVTESLDTSKKGLRYALLESYNAASEEDKAIMKDTLNELDIPLESKLTESNWANAMNTLEVEITPEEESLTEEGEEVPIEGESPEDIPVEINSEDVLKNETSKAETSEQNLSEITLTQEEVTAFVKDIINKATKLSKNKNLSKKDDIDDIDSLIQKELEKVVEDKTEKIGYDSGKSDNIDTGVKNDTLSNTEPATDEEDNKKTKTKSKEVIDNEATDGLLEQLKTLVRQNSLFESTIKELRNAKTVSDTEVEELTESLEKYKNAFARVSKIAAKATMLEKKVKNLTEELSHTELELKVANERNSVELQEGLQHQSSVIKNMTERLSAKEKELQESKQKLNEQTKLYNQKLTESKQLTDSYKSKFTNVLNSYINYRASLLGVKPSEITNRLNESFTMNDINSVCDTILNEGTRIQRMPFNVTPNSKVKISAPKSAINKQSNSGNGYPVDDSLLELAGLK